jgi:rhamnogalacturonan endolyase
MVRLGRLRPVIGAVAGVLVFVAQGHAGRYVERLDRGAVAMAAADGRVYVGWRLLASDPPGIGFDVLRSIGRDGSWEKLTIEAITDSSNFVDTTAGGTSWYYRVQPVDAGVQSGLARSDPADAQRGCLTIRLQGDYGANKLALADLDGDGVYDFIIKQPAGSIDPGSPRRSPDTYKIEAYNGKTGGFMWRYDLGWNINMGIWFSPMVVYDLDGDGRAEVVSKWLHPLRAREQVSGMRRKGHAGIGRDSVCLGGSR